MFLQNGNQDIKFKVRTQKEILDEFNNQYPENSEETEFQSKYNVTQRKYSEDLYEGIEQDEGYDKVHSRFSNNDNVMHDNTHQHDGDVDSVHSGVEDDSSGEETPEKDFSGDINNNIRKK